MQTLDELNAQIAATLAPIARTETVALDDACGRVLAEAITSNIELPVADVSAMDSPMRVRVSPLFAVKA